MGKSRDIGFVHCKVILTKSDKQGHNGLESIILDYEARIFRVTSIFADNAFKPLNTWMRQDLYVDLITCTADLHLPRAENAIRFVKERVGCIQSESLFTRYPKRLTIEMVKRVTILIN